MGRGITVYAPTYFIKQNAINTQDDQQSISSASKTRPNPADTARNGVERLRVFGSVARGTEDEQSDIDFLVELAPNRRLLDLGNFLYEVRSLLGKEVDVLEAIQKIEQYARDETFSPQNEIWWKYG